MHFRPIVKIRSSEQVADEIRRTILEGKYLPGDKLPPERALAEYFQVTRNTVREALRFLEQMRLVSVRQGSGITVEDYLATTGLEFIGALLDNPDEGTAGLIEEIAEARQVIGEAMVNNAIDRIDTYHIEALREAVESFLEEVERQDRDVNRLQELDFEIHNRLMQAGGNRPIILLHNSMRHVYRQVAHLFEPLLEHPAEIALFYRQMIDALESGDRMKARDLFRDYFKVGTMALKRYCGR